MNFMDDSQDLVTYVREGITALWAVTCLWVVHLELTRMKKGEMTVKIALKVQLRNFTVIKPK